MSIFSSAPKESPLHWRYLEPMVRYSLICITLSTVIGLSWFQGRYQIDPHHWGLMLSNVQDMVRGRLPYQEIFLQYGILTPIIQGAFYVVLGGTLQSIFFATIAAYVIGLLGIYYLSYELSSSRKLALYALISCALLHPIVIYPWSNYIAFPFLVFGLLFYIKGHKKSWNYLLSGMLFSLAVLCREGLLMPVIAFAVSGILLKLVYRDQFIQGRELVYFLVGLSFPLALFFIYLIGQQILGYWYIDAVLLPQAYARQLMGNGIWGSVMHMLSYFSFGLRVLDVRLMLLSLTVFASACTCCAVLLGIGWLRDRWNCFMVGLLSLLLLSSSLHLTELFRLATGMVVGVPLLYFVANRYRIATLLFLGFSIVSGWTIISNPHNDWFPTTEQRYDGYKGVKPSIFMGQRWPKKTFDYYQAVQNDLMTLQTRGCGIQLHINDTEDSFLATISPFNAFQMAPFGRGLASSPIPLFDDLRPEFNFQEKVRSSNGLAILTFEDKKVSHFEPPKGYFIFSSFQAPAAAFIPEGRRLLLLAPLACMPPRTN